MKPHNITDYDRKIIRAIQSGFNTFSLLCTATDSDNCRRDRMLLDRRMQVLRRKGLIIYTGQARTAGWKLPLNQESS
jgi:hypothetical protein